MPRSPRLLLSACVVAFLVGSSSALAQVAPPALSVTLAPVQAAADQAYPGEISIQVDATDIDRRIVSVRQVIPIVQSGPLVLLYPQWIPGSHGPVGPVDDVANLVISADGRRLPWVRNTLATNAFQVEVPQGVSAVEVAFDWLTPVADGQGRVVITDDMLNIQWEKALLYPAGYDFRRMMFRASLRLPDGWNYGTALDTVSFENGLATFAPISLAHFADSPVFAGRHFRQIDLDPGGRSPVRLNIVADEAPMLNSWPEHDELHRNLVRQADRLFGARHYDHYDFLLAVTEELGGIGLEHHRSSENSVDTRYFVDQHGTIADRDLLGHEYVHSWNGKWRRPADQLVADLNTPLQNSLLWVYEGQTQYWGLVLTARAGLMTKQQALDVLANTAATYADDNPGRAWRAMQDTTNDPIIAQRRPQPWPSLQRSEDYYREGAMIWLDVDTWIRERSGGRRSLDDFAKAFFGVQDGNWDATPYTFEDVASTLDGVQANDWADFLRTRLDAAGPDSRGPLGGIDRGGYQLVWRETPNEYSRALNTELGRNDFIYSLGIRTNGQNEITLVQWGSPAFEQRLTTGWEIMAVNGRAASPAAIADAVTAAKDGGPSVEMMVSRGDRFRTIRFDYNGGLRYPHLERIPDTPDRLGEILTAREN